MPGNPSQFSANTSRPPVVANPLPKELLPAELQSILVRLGQKYGAGLRVSVTDAEWVEVSVDNLSAAQLHDQLQSERNILFGTAESRLQGSSRCVRPALAFTFTC